MPLICNIKLHPPAPRLFLPGDTYHDAANNSQGFQPGGEGGGGTWGFFGWVCAAQDSKLAPRSRKNFP